MGKTIPNIHFSSNNLEFSESLSEVYGRCLYLPNLYDLESSPEHHRHHHLVKHSLTQPPLRIASFGASRLLKLHPSAALAALQIARAEGRQLEFYVNTDKTPGGESVRRTVRNMFAGLEDAKLIEVGWQDGQVFKKTISSMD